MNLFNAHEDMVKWMAAFGQETPAEPCFPLGTVDLRVKLILEECKETEEAFIDHAVGYAPYTDILDGLGDSLFVIIGTFVALGVPTEEVYKEVCRSNWSKFWSGKEVKAANLDNTHTVFDFRLPNLKQGELADYSNDELKTFVVKNAAGKVIKSPSFSPPNFDKWIPKQKQLDSISLTAKERKYIFVTP
jgi:hypothetical protein